MTFSNFIYMQMCHFASQYLIMNLFFSLLKINQIFTSISAFNKSAKIQINVNISNLIHTSSPTNSFATTTVGLTRFDCISGGYRNDYWRPVYAQISSKPSQVLHGRDFLF